MYSVPVAYLLWFLSGFGMAGFHRFYLGKIGTGILYLGTCGLAGIGGIYDFFTLPRQVREANIRNRFKAALEYDEYRRMHGRNRRNSREDGYLDYEERRAGGFGTPKAETPERIILKIAKKNGGMATASEVALEGDISMDDAKKYLDQLTSKGYAEMRITKNGVIVYVFPEFTLGNTKPDFENI